MEWIDMKQTQNENKMREIPSFLAYRYFDCKFKVHAFPVPHIKTISVWMKDYMVELRIFFCVVDYICFFNG